MNYKYRDYVIKPDKLTPSCNRINFDGTGKVPECLSGLFTSVGIAKKAIDNYLFGRVKGKVNAEANN